VNENAIAIKSKVRKGLKINLSDEPGAEIGMPTSAMT
jgi:hypothetical protein